MNHYRCHIEQAVAAAPKIELRAFYSHEISLLHTPVPTCHLLKVPATFLRTL